MDSITKRQERLDKLVEEIEQLSVRLRNSQCSFEKRRLISKVIILQTKVKDLHVEITNIVKLKLRVLNSLAIALAS